MTGTAAAGEVACFGYGSLVNEVTWRPWERRHPVRYRAEVVNWRREWRHCLDPPEGPGCVLTAATQAGSRIQGVFIRCGAADLAEIDAREDGYDRVELPRRDVVSCAGELPERLFIYRSKPSQYRLGSRAFPVWYSYAEAVLHGFMTVFPTEGIDAFIASTGGWTVPIVDDRADPLYTRAPTIPATERRLIEGRIRAIPGVRVIPHAVRLRRQAAP